LLLREDVESPRNRDGLMTLVFVVEEGFKCAKLPPAHTYLLAWLAGQLEVAGMRSVASVKQR